MVKAQGEEEFTVLYDGECAVCRAAVERLRAWDKTGALSFMTAQDPSARVRFPWISREDLEESIHLVALDGRTWEGASAVEMLVGVLPSWRWASFLFRFPLARPVARRIYRWVAMNRYRLSCGDHCRG